ncbi:protein of unknown function [Micropruina glycogenica]|uniref:Uncharacterized protein n=1 Tax=Micropruina glycogenica TaxID=75385 RepID=A0A2N9JDB7_9ACTN|nr:protein of unknown function [Micropruina glycogenica]
MFSVPTASPRYSAAAGGLSGVRSSLGIAVLKVMVVPLRDWLRAHVETPRRAKVRGSASAMPCP